jgi:hypothetical protein
MKKFINWLKSLALFRKKNKIKILFRTPRHVRRANERTIEKQVVNNFSKKYSQYL